jgi:hypothetical protein
MRDLIWKMPRDNLYLSVKKIWHFWYQIADPVRNVWLLYVQRNWSFSKLNEYFKTWCHNFIFLNGIVFFIITLWCQFDIKSQKTKKAKNIYIVQWQFSKRGLVSSLMHPPDMQLIFVLNESKMIIFHVLICRHEIVRYNVC